MQVQHDRGHDTHRAGQLEPRGPALQEAAASAAGHPAPAGGGPAARAAHLVQAAARPGAEQGRGRRGNGGRRGGHLLGLGAQSQKQASLIIPNFWNFNHDFVLFDPLLRMQCALGAALSPPDTRTQFIY